MKKMILPILFVGLFAVGCASDHNQRTANADDSFNSPTYDRILTESQLYSPGALDNAAARSDSDIAVRESPVAAAASAATAESLASDQAASQSKDEVAGEISATKNQTAEQPADQSVINQAPAQVSGEVADTADAKTAQQPSENSSSVSAQTETEAGTNSQALTPTSDRTASRVYDTKTNSNSSTENKPDTTQTKQTTGTESTLVIQIRRAVSGDPSLAAIAPDLQITTDYGRVTLRGTVKSEQQKKDVEALVKQTTGVTSVENELTTSP